MRFIGKNWDCTNNSVPEATRAPAQCAMFPAKLLFASCQNHLPFSQLRWFPSEWLGQNIPALFMWTTSLKQLFCLSFSENKTTASSQVAASSF